MALAKNNKGGNIVGDFSSITLASTTSPLSPKQIMPGVSINKNLKLIAPRLQDGLACLNRTRQTTHHVVTSEEQERKRISRELHDGLGQLLTSMGLHVKRCLDGSDAEGQGLAADQRESLEALSSMVKQAIAEVRTICSAIRPAILDDLGVVAAISWQCRQIAKISSATKVVTDFDVDEACMPEDYKSVIYRIVQEALNNAVKYSKAQMISVSLLQAHDAIHLLVSDDGVGFDPSEIQGKLGMGLVGMRERAESVEGRIRIDTSINQGVQIRASFPL